MGFADIVVVVGFKDAGLADGGPLADVVIDFAEAGSINSIE